MRHLILIFFLFYVRFSYAQLSTLQDFEGESFDFNVSEILSTNDSLYIISSNGGKNDLGLFYRLDRNGGTVDTIFNFDINASLPLSMIGNESVIYGTTRLSSGGSSAIFRYSIQSGSFEILNTLSNVQGQNVSLILLTDSLLYGVSDSSLEDEGNVFSIDLDGDNFTKIYNDTNLNTGQNPTDLVIVDNKIFITFFNGGGIPFDGVSGTFSSGSIGRVDIDGSNFETIVQGRNLFGTQPRSILFDQEVFYVYFTEAGSIINGQIVSFDFEGNNQTTLAEVGNIGRGRLSQINDLIFGVTSGSLFSYNITNDSFSNLITLNLETGIDVDAFQAAFERDFIFGTRQGGIGGAGSLLRFIINESPEAVSSIEDQNFPETFEKTFFSVLGLFEDTDGDTLNLNAIVSNDSIISVQIKNDSIVIEELGSLGGASVSIVATDFFLDSDTVVFEFTVEPFFQSTLEFNPGLRNGSISWGDVNNDGRLDFVQTGNDIDANAETRLFLNNGVEFDNTETSIPSIFEGTSDWGDYDNDGDQDLLIAGLTSSCPVLKYGYRLNID